MNISGLTTNSFASQVIFPDSLLTLTSHSFLVGWNLDSFRCCVAFAVELPIHCLYQLEEVLRNSPASVFRQLDGCSQIETGYPCVLGEWMPPSAGLEEMFPPENCGIWITMTTETLADGKKRAKLKSIYSMGFSYETKCFLVQYSSRDALETFPFAAARLRAQPHSKSDLDHAVVQIASAAPLRKFVESKFSQMHVTDAEESGLVTGILSNLLYHSAMLVSWLGLEYTSHLRWMFMLSCSIPWLNRALISWLGTSSLSSSRGVCLCDVSLTAAQLSHKWLCIECCFFKAMLLSSSNDLSAASRASLHLEVLSFITISVLDVCLGLLVGYFVFQYAQLIIQVVSDLSQFLERKLILDSLVWFEGSPGGVKLNPLITKNVGKILKAVVSKFAIVFLWSSPAYPVMVQILGCIGCLGFTFQLDLVVDLIRILTFHISLIHRMCALQHMFHLQLLSSLWLLFQGKKSNILRNRVDSLQYDRHRLLFGTILSAITTFLYPSFAVYFYLFSLMQFVVVCTQVTIWSLCVALKEFPLLHLVSMVRDKTAFSDSIYLDIQTCSATVVKKRKKSVTFSSAKPSSHQLSDIMDSTATNEGEGEMSQEAEKDDDGVGLDGTDETAGGGGEIDGANNTKKILSWLMSEQNQTSQQWRNQRAYSQRRGRNSSLPAKAKHLKSFKPFTDFGPSQVISICLVPRPRNFTQIFGRYWTHWKFLWSTRGLGAKLLNGILTGFPALDIILIQSATQLSNSRVNEFSIPSECRSTTENDRSAVDLVPFDDRHYLHLLSRHGKLTSASSLLRLCIIVYSIGTLVSILMAVFCAMQLSRPYFQFSFELYQATSLLDRGNSTNFTAFNVLREPNALRTAQLPSISSSYG